MNKIATSNDVSLNLNKGSV